MSIEKISINQIKAGRALLGWSQSRLATESGLSEPTIKRLEAKGGYLSGRADTCERVCAALVTAGIEFTNGNSPGVRLTVRK